MKKIFIFLLFFLALQDAQSQFINNGGTVTVQSGAVLRVESSVQNNSTGTITNNGRIEVSGDFTNAATAVLTPAVGTVKFIGTTNANLDTGGDALHHVEMAKTANATVTLSAPVSMSGDLSFTGAGSRLVLGVHNATMAATSAVITPGAAGYVVTNGSGQLIRGISASNPALLMPVGDATNYSPVSCNITGSAIANASIKTRVYTTSMQKKLTGTTDSIAREWRVISEGITGYNNTMTGTYVAGDITGSAGAVKGATYESADWKFASSAAGANTVIAATTNPDIRFSGMNFFANVFVKVFLQGPYNAGSGAMSTTLKNNNLIPLTSPYTDAPATVTEIPAGVTDWIKIELRDPAAPTTATSNKASAFLKSNGEIVGLDGTSLPKVKNGYPTSVVVLSHRNHLSIRTPNAGINTLNPSSIYDFSIATSQAHINTSNTNNANMATLASGVFGMWSGNVNGNTNVRYSGSANDNNTLLNTILGGNKSLVLSNIYSSGDLNFNGNVRYSGAANDNNVLLNVVLGGNKSIVFNEHLN
jgi:hypothetical protein